MLLELPSLPHKNYVVFRALQHEPRSSHIHANSTSFVCRWHPSGTSTQKQCVVRTKLCLLVGGYYLKVVAILGLVRM